MSRGPELSYEAKTLLFDVFVGCAFVAVACVTLAYIYLWLRGKIEKPALRDLANRLSGPIAVLGVLAFWVVFIGAGVLMPAARCAGARSVTGRGLVHRARAKRVDHRARLQ